MKHALAFLLLVVAALPHTRAADLIIERIIIDVTPIQGTYFVAMSAEADKATGAYYVPGKPCKGRVEIPVNVELKGIELNRWCKVTLHLDTADDDVATYKAVEKHAGRFQIHAVGTEAFIAKQNWSWRVVYRTK